MPAHRTVLESENSSKADNARKNTAFPPVCKKCAEPQKMENPTRNLTILRGILVRSRGLEPPAYCFVGTEWHILSISPFNVKSSF